MLQKINFCKQNIIWSSTTPHRLNYKLKNEIVWPENNDTSTKQLTGINQEKLKKLFYIKGKI